jgi:hypothetical protein
MFLFVLLFVVVLSIVVSIANQKRNENNISHSIYLHTICDLQLIAPMQIVVVVMRDYRHMIQCMLQRRHYRPTSE